MSKYEIVPYAPELEAGIIDLRHLAWDSDPSAPKRFLDWKYKQNPYIPEPIMYVAVHEGRVVGMRGAYGTCWEAVGASRVVIPAADDFAILPEHRNSGVATFIIRAMIDDLTARGFPFVLGLSSGRMTTLASLAAGWKSAGPMEPVARFDLTRRVVHGLRERLRHTRFVWRLVRNDLPIVETPDAPFRRLDAVEPAPGREPGTTIVFERAVRAEAMAALIERLGHDGRIRQVRDAAFLAWRYRNPAREYGFFYLQRDGQLEAFIALGCFPSYRPPMLPFHIIDWEGVSAAAREELLTVALRHGRFPEIGAWNAGVHEEDRAVLEAAGFMPAELESRARGLPCVLVRGLGGAPAAEWKLGNRHLTEPSDWDMRLLYSMHG